MKHYANNEKVYEFATIPTLISNKLFFSISVQVLHFLTEIRDSMETIGNLLKAKNTSFKLTTYENLDDFYKFDQLLKDKVIEKNIVRKITFTV